MKDLVLTSQLFIAVMKYCITGRYSIHDGIL